VGADVVVRRRREVRRFQQLRAANSELEHGKGLCLRMKSSLSVFSTEV
jgi:hypothetical protein